VGIETHTARFPGCRAQTRPDGDSHGYIAGSQRPRLKFRRRGVTPRQPGPGSKTPRLWFITRPCRVGISGFSGSSRVRVFPAHPTFSTASWVRSAEKTFPAPSGRLGAPPQPAQAERGAYIFNFQVSGGHWSSQTYPDQTSTAAGLHSRDKRTRSGRRIHDADAVAVRGGCEPVCFHRNFMVPHA
jgi:hypothetical protein